jgi:hypothetical protein
MKRFILAQLILLLVILATIPVMAYVSSQPPGYTAVSCGVEVEEDTGTILRLVQSRMRTEDATEAVAMTEMICRVASRHGLRPTLIAAVVECESTFNPRALSKKKKWDEERQKYVEVPCAYGLMQIIPANFGWMGITDPFDPEQSLEGGCKYLAGLSKKYNGDERKMFGHYNGGYRPDNPETRAYVPKVLRVEMSLRSPQMPLEPTKQIQREKILPSQERGKETAKIYRVRAGDTLWRIAQRYGTTVERLARANGIHNPDRITAGERLEVGR